MILNVPRQTGNVIHITNKFKFSSLPGDLENHFIHKDNIILYTP